MAADAVPTTFPHPLGGYADPASSGLFEIMAARAQAEPFNAVATVIFLLAVIHTFFAQRFRAAAHDLQERHDQQARASGREPGPAFAAEVLHFFGEVEVVFGLWAVVLVGAIVAFFDWSVAQHYVSDTVNFTEPMFVVVIMALASTRPVLVLAERVLSLGARLGGSTPTAWWLTILTVGPLLGSLITEPAAMTICALLLARHFYERRPGLRLAYATLGLLFVNVSVGGTLTHFAAPPVLMVARPWGWDLEHMLRNFGAEAVAGILTANLATFAVFHRELQAMAANAPPSATVPYSPNWVIVVHLVFMAFTVANAHYPPLFVAGFLFFLGFAQATAAHQNAMDLKPPLLVGFFLAGLVVHGGLQGWWIAPVLESLTRLPLFAGAALLTAFNDNALITYLATLVPGLTDAAKHAVVAGAVTGGGLTVIANAPNPAGQSILNRYFEDGISPIGLLLGAIGPTLVLAAWFLLLR